MTVQTEISFERKQKSYFQFWCFECEWAINNRAKKNDLRIHFHTEVFQILNLDSGNGLHDMSSYVSAKQFFLNLQEKHQYELKRFGL